MQDINYPEMIDQAMRGVVREVLTQVEEEGLPGDHHFFISFRTRAPGVRISETLRTRFPDEMTIVVQHQFWDLQVDHDHFSINLSFNNIPERLHVPFAALTAFADPSIKFGLQFHSVGTIAQESIQAEVVSASLRADRTFESAETTSESEAPAAEIISLDAFRKKT